MALSAISKNLLSLFLRRTCPFCGAGREEGELLCPWCSLRIEPCRTVHRSIDGTPLRGVPSPDGDSVPVHSAVLYSGLPGELLRRLKFHGERYLASTAAALIRKYSTRLPEQGWTIVPVPVSWRRKRERGYNQAALIARKLAALTGCRTRRLLRRDDGPSQVGLSTSMRRDNVREVFHLRSRTGSLKGRKLCLVDDVATTFSTVHSAAAVLLENGADSVFGLTMAYRRKAGVSIIPDELTSR